MKTTVVQFSRWLDCWRSGKLHHTNTFECHRTQPTTFKIAHRHNYAIMHHRFTTFRQKVWVIDWSLTMRHRAHTTLHTTQKAKQKHTNCKSVSVASYEIRPWNKVQLLLSPIRKQFRAIIEHQDKNNHWLKWMAMLIRDGSTLKKQ